MVKKKKKKEKMTLDKLAIIMAGSFSGFEMRIDKRFEVVGQRFDEINTEIKGIKNQLEGVNNRIDDMATNRVKYTEFNSLKKRVDVLEKRC